MFQPHRTHAQRMCLKPEYHQHFSQRMLNSGQIQNIQFDYDVYTTCIKFSKCGHIQNNSGMLVCMQTY